MTRIALIAALSTTHAFAHPAAVPHVHPHGPSALPGLDTLLLAALLVAFGALAAKMLQRK